MQGCSILCKFTTQLKHHKKFMRVNMNRFIGKVSCLASSFVSHVILGRLFAACGLLSSSVALVVSLEVECWFCVYRVTVETPSMNLVLYKTLALLNMPSLRDTTMNCECLKWARNIWPMFWVWDKSNAASTSSKI